MRKLISLEIKKFKLSGYIKGVVIINLIMLVLLFMGEFSKVPMFSNFNDAFSITNIMVRATFTIFAAVLISKLIISEYKNKTINILFAYPISRKKIMLSKLAIVVIFVFASMIITNVFLDFGIYVLNIFINFINVPLTQNILVVNLINVSINSVAFSFVSLIPLLVGMKKKSESATIVTSVILVNLLNLFNNESNMNSLIPIILVPIILAIIGAFVAYLSIKDVEKVDV